MGRYIECFARYVWMCWYVMHGGILINAYAFTTANIRKNGDYVKFYVGLVSCKLATFITTSCKLAGAFSYCRYIHSFRTVTFLASNLSFKSSQVLSLNVPAG